MVKASNVTLYVPLPVSPQKVPFTAFNVRCIVCVIFNSPFTSLQCPLHCRRKPFGNPWTTQKATLFEPLFIPVGSRSHHHHHHHTADPAPVTFWFKGVSLPTNLRGITITYGNRICPKGVPWGPNGFQVWSVCRNGFQVMLVFQGKSKGSQPSYFWGMLFEWIV